MSDEFARIVELEARLERALAQAGAAAELRADIVIALETAEEVRDEIEAIETDVSLMSQEFTRLHGVVEGVISRLSERLAQYGGSPASEEGDDER